MSFDSLSNGLEQWRLGIFIALLLHVTVLILAIFGPDLIQLHRQNQEIYTVKLLAPSMLHSSRQAVTPPGRTPAKSPPVTKPGPRPQHHTPEISPKNSRQSRPVHVKKAKASVPAKHKKETSKRSVQPATSKKKKAVSLNPEKKKQTPKKAEGKTKHSTPAKSRKKKIHKRPKGPSPEEVLRKRLSAIKQQVKEKEEERHLEERIKALSQKIRQKQDTTGRSTKGQTSGTSVTGKGKTINEIIANYGNEVSRRIWRRWNLPTEIIDSKGLEAIIEIEIADDGTIISRKFEKTSGNMLFDQSAMRAVKDATPVPPLPPQLRPGPLVMGIRFRPEGM